MKIVFVISGHAQNGKDTTAALMQAELLNRGIMSEHEAFAKLLKEQAKMLGWSGRKDERGRTLLQHLGDVVKEYHGPQYYAEECVKRIEISDRDVFFITDLRFRYEIEYLRKWEKESGNKLVTIRVHRPFDGTWSDGLTQEQRNHISETDLDNAKFDYYLENDGSIDHLERTIRLAGIIDEAKK